MIALLNSWINDTLLAGACLSVAGISGLARHFLLEPRIATYPRAPKPLLAVFFVTSVTFLFLGARFLAVYVNGERGVPPEATHSLALLAVVLMLYKLSNLVNVLRQHYPATVWSRINRISDILKCRAREKPRV